MDRHDNLAVSATTTAPRHEVMRELSDRDRQAVHRLFRAIRTAAGAPSHHHVAALPHP